MRRLPLLLLLILLPVPAQAHRHVIEAFAGVSTEEGQSLAARVSVGVRVLGTKYGGNGSTAPGIADGRSRTRPSAMMGMGTQGEADAGPKPAKWKGSLFLVAEAAEYIAGRDSGRGLDGWMFGARYFVRGGSTIEPFFHIMGGRQRPSRPNTLTAGDDATNWACAGSLGAGVDLEVNPSRTAAIVPVLRLQFDLVDSGATSGPFGRATFGLSFRYEKD